MSVTMHLRIDKYSKIEITVKMREVYIYNVQVDLTKYPVAAITSG